MRKNFNSVQMLKSSEDCKKFSKSVSYETLVGGTTTTGRGIKQTRRLFLSSADKPLSAVGTLTSLLCNSAKVVEKWLQNPFIFKMVKVLMIVVVLSTGIISESWAACGSNCYRCSDDGTTCLQCMYSGYLSIGNDCSNCSDEISGCNTCGFDSEKNRVFCMVCNSNLLLSEDKASCVSNTITCANGYTLVDGKCEYNPWCSNYGPSTNYECKNCGTGYHLDSNSKKCIADEVQETGQQNGGTQNGRACADSNCTDCSRGFNSCSICKEGYYIYNARCVSIDNAPSCSSGEFDYNHVCNDNGIPGCAEGYVYQHQLSCVSCESNNSTIKSCHTDDITKKLVPDSCINGYYVKGVSCLPPEYCTGANYYINTTTGKCEKKPDGCKNVNSDGTCADEKCWKGYAKNASGICEKVDCPENCEDCNINKQCTECTGGFLTKEGGCVEPSSCTGEYLISGNECIKMPGCVNFADGACGSCEKGYYKKETGCVPSSDGCGADYLEKDSVCISASLGCGAGYKNMGGYCNHVQWTPAEAAEVLTDDNNNSVTITFRK